MDSLSNKNIIRLTVFTPTYNRAHTLSRTYESLCIQNNKHFEWLIIDDGSTDDTKNIVNNWIKEDKIKIRYLKKENGGLFTGYNEAVANIESELCVCIDSDDFMPNNAISKILEIWDEIDDEEIAGIIGLDHNLQDEPIGGKFREIGYYYFLDQMYKLNHWGDTKVVCRTDLMKKYYPMPSFGEKNFNPVWYYLKVGENNKFKLVNENFCIVDYQENGMSKAIFRQFIDSPKSFAELRKVYMVSRHLPLRRIFIDAAHYVSSSIFYKNWNFIKESPRPFITFISIPLGFAINLLIRYKSKIG